MLFFSYGLAALAVTFAPRVAAVASTDSYTDADVMQSGYLPNHNMDPNVVNSAQFGQLWKVPFNSKEQFYAKPLVYTPLAGGAQILFLASSQNYIRTVNAKTGVVLNSRQVHTPFLQSDIGCTDIPNTIGITGTPVIDPATDIAYFFSKTYIPNFRYAGNTGTFNGVYYFHGVNVNTLADVFPPILVDGSVADNAPQKYFVGGVILQRPSLLQVGSVVYGAFGGHCDLFNYTGVVIGVDVNQQKIVTQFATESGPLAEQTNIWNDNGGGGQAGIWMGGMALSSDSGRLFFVTGNGGAHQNQGTPAAGSSGCQTLGEACINLNIGDGGKLALADYFQPYDYQNMDGGDQDFGAGGVALLNPSPFSGTGVAKMAVTAGKNGKIYILNANNLGGYRLGVGQTDGVIQTIVTDKAVFGGSGSYPLEGGYIYSTPVGYPTYAYKLGFSDGGVPVFALAGQTNEVSAGRIGVGVPTITSYQGQAGTGILWMTDPDAGLRAWNAVPVGGVLKTIPLPQVGGANKFQRPAFGDARLYVTDSNGNLYCLGSPVNLPLNCTSPVQFGNVALGSSAHSNVTCKTNIAITSINGMTVGDPHFEVSNATLPKGPLAAGVTFTFPVTWDLTNSSAANMVNASSGNVDPGIKSTPLTLYTTNAVAGYTTAFPIGLTGTEVSQAAYLSLTPVTVDYSGLVLLPGQSTPTASLPFVIGNLGLSPMTILGYAYTTDDLGQVDTTFTNVTFFANGTALLGEGFTSDNLPPQGTVVQPNQQISIDSTFYPYAGVGSYNSYLMVYTDGGSAETTLEGSASTAPIANFSISNGEGGWLPGTNLLMDFGDCAPGSTQGLQIQICNNGGSVLDISKSKPPNGVFHPDDPTELHEEQQIPIGACAYGNVLFTPPTIEYNAADVIYTNTWTLNTADLTFGVHVVQIQGTLVSNKVGPTNSTNQAVYTYLGCYKDSPGGGARLLPSQLYVGANNSNNNCQQHCYTAAAGAYAFEGTEYQTECYCGNNPPSTQWLVADAYCSFACSGDGTDACGGTGGYISIYYDATKYTPGNNSVIITGPTGGPVTVQSAGNYNYVGCYSEATTGRALSALQPKAPTSGFTIELCEAACQGYQLFGMEYSNECYCGNTLGAGSVNQTSSSPTTNGCSMLCTGNSTEYCGGPGRLDLYQLNGSVPIPTQTLSSAPTATGGPIVEMTAGPYNYVGCYIDNTNGRALSALQNPESGALNTPDKCATACAGYLYMGVEYGTQCYCDNVIGGGNGVAPGGNVSTANGCNMPCAGNSSEWCGGPNRLNLYTLNPNATIITPTPTPTPGAPITVGNFKAWSYMGCYTEATNTRALSGLQNPIPGAAVTVEACSAACSAYLYFGVEYSDECYCGNIINAGSVLATGTTPSANGCNMLCSGNSTEYCGGRNRLNMYNQIVSSSTTSSSVVTVSTTTTPTTSTVTTTSATSTTATTTVTTGTTSGSSTSTTSSTSTLPLSTTTTTTSLSSPTSSSTISSSSSSASSSPSLSTTSTIAVTSTTLTTVTTTSPSTTTTSTSTTTTSVPTVAPTTSTSTSSTVSSTTSSTSSTTTTSGTTTGTTSTSLTGSSTVSTTTVSSTTSSSSSLSTTTTTTSSTTSTTSSTTTVVPTPSQTSSSPWVYLGCANETNPRALNSASYADGTHMTIESCQAYCSSSTNNYRLAGLEYASQCFCGNALQQYSALGFTGCNMACTGNSSELCGGSSRLSVYNLTTYAPPAVVSAVGNYISQGCYNELANRRLLNGPSFTNATGMTVEACVGFCKGSSPSQAYAGVEYAQECYCGSSLPTGATTAPASSCNMLCKGNNKEFCGAGNLLNV
ncbi:hypothetical protein MMC19_002188, partial [Ptychographa xylographoides]|nr:hypothetical protein [Ptychographa xylographoides]